MEFPTGFSQLQNAAGESIGFFHYCGACHQSTTLPDAKILEVWHCGAIEKLELTVVGKLRMPTVRLEPRRFGPEEMLRRGIVPVGAEIS